MTTEETIPIDRWLRHLNRFLKVARAGIDPEGVHQVRVATRRLDAWLVLGGWRVYRDDLRWLRRRASTVRDLDALLGRKGLPKSIRQPLMGMKRQAHADFRLACDDQRLAALMVGLATLHPLKIAEARKLLSRMLRDASEAGEEVETDGSNLEALHRLRRALRRLRYGLESIGKSTSPLKQLQEMLGNVNDLAVSLRCLDQLPSALIPPRYRSGLEDELALSLPLARGLWIDEKHEIKRTVV